MQELWIQSPAYRQLVDQLLWMLQTNISGMCNNKLPYDPAPNSMQIILAHPIVCTQVPKAEKHLHYYVWWFPQILEY